MGNPAVREGRWAPQYEIQSAPIASLEDSMARANRTFRIFVSSTFNDLRAERDALHEQVFPKLRQLCAQRGCHFQAIDLRWGIGDEATLDHQTAKICLEEVVRCRKVSSLPIFVLLLGDRYGWRPLPAEIPAEQFEGLLQHANTEEIPLLHLWFERDDNAVPPVYYLKRRTGEYVDPTVWEVAERRLRATLLRTTTELRLTPEQRLRYDVSITEQEFDCCVLRSLEPNERVFAFLRTISDLPEDPRARDYVDLDPDGSRNQAARARLEDLKNRLRDALAGRIRTYQASWQEEGVDNSHIAQLCIDVHAEVSQAILDNIALNEDSDYLQDELADYDSFREEQARLFVGRHAERESIESYIAGDVPHALGIFGEPGSGKSALMAFSVTQALEHHAGSVVVCRFIGAVPGSCNLQALLESLCRQISYQYGAPNWVTPTGYADLVREFSTRLALATAKRPLVLFLDALDQLFCNDEPPSLNWLPNELPSHVRVVVSLTPGPVAWALKAKLADEFQVRLGPMPPDECDALLSAWLKDVQRTLQPAQRQVIVDKASVSGLPLYLKLVFEQARSWRSSMQPPTLGPNVAGLIRALFKRLSANSNHGDVLLDRSLGYLAVARHGLSEDELMDLLSRDPHVIEEVLRRFPRSPAIRRLPTVLWSRLHFDLAPFLSERQAYGTYLMTLNHQELSVAVEQEFLANGRRTCRHQSLAQYFGEQPYWMETQGKSTANVRKVAEQPWQQARADWVHDCQRTLGDLDFMIAKCTSLGLNALIEDYNLVTPQPRTLRILRQALLLSGYALSTRPYQLPGHLVGRLADSDDPTVRNLLDQVILWRRFPWLRPATKSLSQPGGPLDSILTGHTYWVVAIAVSQKQPLLATGSRDATVKLWHLETGEEVRTLTQPWSVGALAMSPDGKWLAVAPEAHWTRGEEQAIRIWNTATGEFARTLDSSGDTDHNALTMTPDGLQVLAGSSDYKVRIWNIQDGRLLHTLSGHTRDVTAIAVTPDGNWVISGSIDFTIRVWERATGKLLRTLEGHHSTVNDLAITPDGQWLISACGHVFLQRYKWDRTPVVYKSWDYDLKVWDLQSGRALKTLHGHSGPVHGVAAFADGKRAVSASYDGTIRLWNLEEGRELMCVKAHEGGVERVKVFAGDRVVTIAGAVRSTSSEQEGRPPRAPLDYSPRLWDLAAPSEAAAPEPHSDSILRVSFAASGQKAVSASYDGCVGVWEVSNGRLLCKLTGHDGPVFSAAISPNGLIVSSAGTDFTIRAWDLTRIGKPTTLLGKLHRILFAGAKNCRVLRLTQQPLNLDISTDARWIVFADSFGHLGTWRIGKKRAVFLDGFHRCIHLAFGDSSKSLLAVDFNEKLLLEYSVDGGQLLRSTALETAASLQPQPATLNWAAVSRSGNRILVSARSGSNSSLAVLDGECGKELAEWEAPDAVVAVAISSNGDRAVTTGLHDHTLKVWDLSRQEVIAAFTVEGPLKCVAIDDSGSSIMAGERSGKVHIFHLMQ